MPLSDVAAEQRGEHDAERDQGDPPRRPPHVAAAPVGSARGRSAPRGGVTRTHDDRHHHDGDRGDEQPDDHEECERVVGGGLRGAALRTGEITAQGDRRDDDQDG